MSIKNFDNGFKTISPFDLQEAISKAIKSVKPLEDGNEYVAFVNDLKYTSGGRLSFSVNVSVEFEDGKEPF